MYHNYITLINKSLNTDTLSDPVLEYKYPYMAQLIFETNLHFINVTTYLISFLVVGAE